MRLHMRQVRVLPMSAEGRFWTRWDKNRTKGKTDTQLSSLSFAKAATERLCAQYALRVRSDRRNGGPIHRRPLRGEKRWLTISRRSVSIKSVWR